MLAMKGFIVGVCLLTILLPFSSYAGKATMEAKDIFTQSSVLFDDEDADATWWSTIEMAKVPNVTKLDAINELFLLRMFAVDLAIFSSFDGEIRTSLRDEVYLYVKKYRPEIADQVFSRQQSYGEVWATSSNLNPDLPKSYWVVKKFSEFCGFEPDPVIQHALTAKFLRQVTTMKKYFSEIQEIYRIVP